MQPRKSAEERMKELCHRKNLHVEEKTAQQKKQKIRNEMIIEKGSKQNVEKVEEWGARKENVMESMPVPQYQAHGHTLMT